MKNYLKSSHAETQDVALVRMLNLSLGYSTAQIVSDWHPSQHSHCEIWGRWNGSEARFSLTTLVALTHYHSINALYSCITCNWHDKHILRSKYQGLKFPSIPHQTFWLRLVKIVSSTKFRFYSLSCKSSVTGKFPITFRLGTEKRRENEYDRF